MQISTMVSRMAVVAALCAFSGTAARACGCGAYQWYAPGYAYYGAPVAYAVPAYGYCTGPAYGYALSPYHYAAVRVSPPLGPSSVGQA